MNDTELDQVLTDWVNVMESAKQHYPITSKTKVISTNRTKIIIPGFTDNPKLRIVNLSQPGIFGIILRFFGRLFSKTKWGYISHSYSTHFEPITIYIDPQLGMGYNSELDILVIKDA